MAKIYSIIVKVEFVLGLIACIIAGIMEYIPWWGVIIGIILLILNLLPGLAVADLEHQIQYLRKTVNSLNSKLDSTNNNLKTNSSSVSSFSYTNSNSNTNSSKSSESNSNGDDEYIIFHQNGRTFARKGSNLYCPNCHAFIDSDSYTMCSNCGKSLTE